MTEKRTFITICLTVILMFTGYMVPEGLCGEKELKEEAGKIEHDIIADANYDNAISDLNKLLKTYPENPRIYLDLGLAYYGLMEYGKAYEYFKKVEQVGAGSGTKEILSYTLAKMDANRSILEKIERLKQDETSEEMAAAQLTMLNELMREKHYYPAVVLPHLLWLKDNVEGFPAIEKLSGDVYYSAMFYKRAAEEYKKAVEKDPENAKLYRTLADCQVAMGDYDGAEENYDKSILLYREDGGRDAKRKIKRISKIMQALPRKYEDVAELMKTGDYDEAEDICRSRISLNSGDYVAITQLGQAFWYKGKRSSALKIFKKVIKIAPDYPVAHLFLGRTYFFQNKTRRAFKEFEVYIEKMDMLPEMDDENKDGYVSNLNYICYLYSTQKKYDDAMRICHKAISLDPEDQAAHYNMGVYYYVNVHNRSRAYSEFQKVIDIDPGSRFADDAKYCVDYMRRNPDSRIIGNFSFVYEE